MESTLGTIAAIATSLHNSSIGIIRVSGGEAVSIVDRIFVNKRYIHILKDMKSHTIHYGYIVENGHEIIDEVMVSYMKAPKSFTAEDTVEINCHGGVLVMQRILELVIKNGARLAEPGEFTKRAFLNGRIDLSKAEAVMDIISSKNKLALQSSVKQLQGAVYDKITDIRKIMIHEIAFIESALDDPEHISLDGYSNLLGEKVDGLLKEIKRLLNTTENGKIIKEGIRAVIVGKPNAGKSTLLNVLSGEERAIVTTIPGTTRDILEESYVYNGVKFVLTDTAGVHESSDIVEKIGIDRAKQAINYADVILVVLDSSEKLEQEDKQILELVKNKKTILVLNKSDKQNKLDLSGYNFEYKFNVSALNKTGIENLKQSIYDLVIDKNIISSNLLITSKRHLQALKKAVCCINDALNSLKIGNTLDVVSIDIKNVWFALGEITGNSNNESIITEIFSSFCVGK